MTHSGAQIGRSTQVWLACSAFVLLLLVVGATTTQTQPGERYFDETGHTVRGPFLAFFESRGDLKTFGYPITDEFVDPSGRLVQYFQRARFEWHPENREGYRVQLGLLGDELGYGRPRLRPDQIPAVLNPYCQYFPETGHSVCNAFLDEFRARGGVEIIGYPISEFAIENDRIVQAFQRARMEWHPERLTGQKVQLTPIGSLAFDAFKLDRSLLGPKALPSQLRLVTRLTVRASVSQPVTGRTGSQTIYAFVADQHGHAVQGALVTAVVHFASGDQTYTMPLTDSRGLTQLVIPFGETRPGEKVSIDMTGAYQNLRAPTRASFLPWW